MADISAASRNAIEDILKMSGGYVLEFSNRTFSEFFSDFGVDIDDQRYSVNGGSKAHRMRTFIKLEPASVVVRILHALWKVREDLNYPEDAAGLARLFKRFESVMADLARAGQQNTDGIDKFARNATLEALVDTIESEITSGRPEMALDRLHTYCVMRFNALLDKHGIAWDSKDTLHNKVGKYAKFAGARSGIHGMTTKIIRAGIGIFDEFNDVRNNHSAAHANVILEPSEARFLIDFVTSYLRFVKRFEGG